MTDGARAAFTGALFIALICNAHGGRPVTLTDLEALGNSDLTMDLSPDGRTLAYALGSDRLRIVNTEPGAVPQEVGPGFLPLWSRGGDKLAFYSLRSGDIQLWSFDSRTLSTVKVTQVAGGIDPDPTSRIQGWVHEAFRYSWSPDGTKLVFASRVPTANSPLEGAEQNVRSAPEGDSRARPLVLTRTSPADWTLSGIFSHSPESIGLAESRDGHSVTMKVNSHASNILLNQIFIVDVASGTVRKLSPSDGSYFNPSWSPDGRTVLCVSSGRKGPVYGAEEIGLYTFDVTSGVGHKLSRGSGVSSRPVWSWDQRQIAYLGSETFFSQNSVYVGSRVSAQVGDTGAFGNVTAGLDRDVERFAWEPDGRTILATYRDGVSTPLVRVAVDSGRREPIAEARHELLPLSVGEIAVSRSGGVAWVQSDPEHPGTIRYSRGPGARQRILVDLYPQMRKWNLGRVEIVRWKNQRGDDMEGTILKPPGFRPGRAYPLIVDAYPLSSGTNWHNPMFGNQAWASMGYLVFRPSPRAPNAWMNPWKSTASSLAGKGLQGWDVTVDDVLSGVNSLIDQGFADPDRMCLYGFSNGGGVVNYLVTRTDRFKCAISVAGALSDWVRPSLLNTDSSAWLAAWAGVSLWDDPTSYINLSAVFGLRKVATPMLLADGDEDGDFLLNTIEMYNGLRHLGIEVTMLRYPNQAHGFTGPALEDFWRREMTFFGRYLEPTPKESETSALTEPPRRPR